MSIVPDPVDDLEWDGLDHLIADAFAGWTAAERRQFWETGAIPAWVSGGPSVVDPEIPPLAAEEMVAIDEALGPDLIGRLLAARENGLDTAAETG